MDLETENRIASILMKEAAELRRQADKEGVHVYLQDRNVRFRPNSRFLTATVLGVQQANRVAEVNDMWRARKKELELDDKLKGPSMDDRRYRDHSESSRSTSSGHREHKDSLRSTSSGQREHISSLAASNSSEDAGLKDDEVQQFLNSRVKRGRGGVGARMDEPGPYLPRTDSNSKSRLSESPDVRDREDWECRVLGPEKPPSLRSKRSFEEDCEEDKRKKIKKVKSSSKKHSKKHSGEEDRHSEKDRKDRKSKHKHKSRRS